MGDEFYNQTSQLNLQDDDIYDIKVNKERFQLFYHRFIQQIDELLSEHEQKSNIVALINKFVDDTSKQLKQISQNSIKNILMFKMKIKEKQQQIMTNSEKIQTLTQNNDILLVKIEHWQRQFQNLKQQNNQITEKYQKRIKEIKKQKKQIKQTFRIVQQNTQIQRMLLQNLQIQKQQISQLILSQKKQKKMILQQLNELKHNMYEINEKSNAETKRIQRYDKQILQLKQQIRQKDAKIKSLQKQIYLYNKNKEQQHDIENNDQKQKIDNFIFNTHFQDKQNQDKNRRLSSFIQINHLSDQINVLQDYQLRKSFMSIVKSDRKSIDNQPINKSVDNQEEDNIEENKQIQGSKNVNSKINGSSIYIPNFYFAHYLLTCQSVKLKLNNEPFFCVDLSTYYKDILDARIPFHMWDQWIINKLKSIVNND